MRDISTIGASVTVPGHVSCPGCGFLSWCMPANLSWHDAIAIERVTEHQRLFKRDSHVFHTGDPLHQLYAVSSGSLKTSIADNDGRLQITGFSLRGEFVGFEAIDSGKYPCNVIALEDSSCCGIRYAELDRLCQQIPALQHHMHRVMSREINRDYGLMFLLGNMRAEERIAQFLLNLSKRYAAGGYSPSHFRLCMSRKDVASYLGIKVETISRVMTRLSDREILAVTGKDIEVLNLDALQRIIGEIEKLACGKAEAAEVELAGRAAVNTG